MRRRMLVGALAVVGAFVPGISAQAGTPSKNFVGGGGVVAACEPVLPGCSTSPLQSIIVGLGVSANPDGTHVRGEITFSAVLTTGPSVVGTVTVQADCLLVGPGNSGGLLAVTGGPVRASTGVFAALPADFHVYVKAFEAAPGSFPADDALNSTPGCAFPDGDVPPLAQPVEHGDINITQGS